MSEEERAAAPPPPPPPPPPAVTPSSSTTTADLLGMNGGAVVPVSPSGSAAAAVMAEAMASAGGGGMNDGASALPAVDEGGMEADREEDRRAGAASADDDDASSNSSGVDTEESGSTRTEESESGEGDSSSSDEDSDDDDNDDDNDDDDDDSSDSEESSSSSSSEDPSVVGTTTVARKPPPETLGTDHPIRSVRSDVSEDPELGVLTKEQVVAAEASLLAPTAPSKPSPEKFNSLYEDEEVPVLDPVAAKTGDDFYKAYGDVTRLMGEGTPLSDEDHQLRPNSRTRRISPQRQQRKVLGQDRASIRQMVVQRMKGKGYNRSRRNRKKGRSARGRSGRPPGVSRRASPMGSPRGGGGGPSPRGWSSPKRRRILYALLAASIGIVGISLIAYGVNKEKQYEMSKDDDYFYNDDFGLEDDEYGDGNGYDNTDYVVDDPHDPVDGDLLGDISGGDLTEEGKSPIHSSPLSPPRPSPPLTATMEPTSLPLEAPGSGLLPDESATAESALETIQDDDALLLFLKQSYASSLGMIDDALAEEMINRLDREVMENKPMAERSLQWKSYKYLLEVRHDIVIFDPIDLAMPEDHILQIYALSVFFDTFGLDHTATQSECDWPGVTCRGLGAHADLDYPAEDDLRVVAINARGHTGPTYRGADYGPYRRMLEGELPIELMFLMDLETLDVSHNQIGGRLEPAMFHWKHMKVLELNDNRLEGDIPPELGSLPNLQKLVLHHNEFQGEVPGEICDLRQTSLHFLWADCSPMPITDVPKVACPIDNCCSICFEGYDDDGGPLTGGTSPIGGQETPHEVVNDKLQNLKDRLSDASADKGAALMDIASPQFRAYAWLVEDATSPDGGDDKYENEQLLQRYALATLYFATNGVHWKENGNWITSADECDWFGISGCEADGASYTDRTVIAINLKENRLEGTIPPEIFEFLPNTIVFNLATNDLSGPIPKEIGMLKKVDILELAENHLTSIPAEMGNLDSMDHVFLQANDFGGQAMPAELCQLRAAGTLTLLWADCRGDGASVQCDPSCCTTCFSGSSSAGDLGLGTAVGGESEEVTHVTHADSDAEVLSRLIKMSPDDGASLDNYMSPQFKAYSWLVGKGVSSYENLSDILLLQRYGMATLYFSLAGHGWTDKEDWLSDKDVCEWESVEACNGVGMATELSLYSNNLIGRIPVEITHIRMLEILDLTDNELYGPIPTEFGEFEDLEILRLGGNLLTGNIPVELGSLTTLNELYLHVNEFEGTNMPHEICALRTDAGLYTLWADCKDDVDTAHVLCEENCCDKCFDDGSDFVFYPGYTETSVPTGNPVARPGPVVPGRTFPPTATPVATGAPVLPENADLKVDLENHMKQSPSFIARLSDKGSHAYKAFLWLGNTQNFDELDEFNRLQRYGLATFYLSTSPDLDYPWKVSNNWNSEEHECRWFGVSCADGNTVTEISLPSNRMSGTIPPEIELAGLGGKLGKLNLAGNNIGGQLPDRIGTLKHLEVLDLRANDFTGQIPPEIGELDTLKSLQLQANELTGVMPAEICALRDGTLEELIADCDADDPFSTVTCEIDTCCSVCY